MSGGVGQAVDHRAGNAVSLQAIDPLALGERREDLVDLRAQHRPMLDARGVRHEARVYYPLGVAEHAGELREETIVTGGGDQGTGLRLERLERDDAIAAGAMALGHGAGRTEARVVPLEPGQPRLEQRGVEDRKSVV